MSVTDRTKLNSLIPNLGSNIVADPEVLETAIIHLYDKVDENFSVMESRTTDPSSPAIGRMWFRADL